MEPLTIWLIGIVAALICGWLASYDLEGATLFQVIRVVAFAVSLVLIDVAAAIKNPVLSGSAIIAILIVVMVGVVAIIGAVIFTRIAEEEKFFYGIAFILLVLGLVATYPGNAYALFSLTAH